LSRNLIEHPESTKMKTRSTKQTKRVEVSNVSFSVLSVLRRPPLPTSKNWCCEFPDRTGLKEMQNISERDQEG